MAVKELSEIHSLLLNTEFQKQDREEIFVFLDLNCHTPFFYETLEAIFKSVVGKELSDPQKEFINEVVLFSRDKFLFMLKHIMNRLNSTSEESSHKKISYINDSLQFCSNILQSQIFFINQLLVLSRIETSYLSDSPLVTLEILEFSFKHCSLSQSMYGLYLSACHENLSSVFKKSVELQAVLFKAFSENYFFNLNVEEDLFFIDKVLKRVSKIGELLVFLDGKSTVDLWKVFIGMVSKFSSCERQKLNVGTIFKSLSNSLSWKITSIPREQNAFSNSVLASLKVCNFIMKVIIKLCSLFANNISESHCQLIKILIKIYGKDQHMEILAGSPNHFESYITVGASSLLFHLVKSNDFVKEYSELCSKLDQMPSNYNLGVYSLTIKILKKIILETNAIQQMWLENNFIVNILEVVQHCSCFLKKAVLSSINEGYSCLVSGLAVLIVSALNKEIFRKVERVLFSKLFHGNYFLKVFISDLLCMLARLTTEQMVINWIVWIQKIPNRPGDSNVHVSILRKRLFEFLSPRTKKSLQMSHPKPYVQEPKRDPTTADFNKLVTELSVCNTIKDQDLMLRLWHASGLLKPFNHSESPGKQSWFVQWMAALSRLTVLSIPDFSYHLLPQVLKEVSVVGKNCQEQIGLHVVQVLRSIVLSVLQRDDQISLDFSEAARSLISCSDPLVGLCVIEALQPLLITQVPSSSIIQQMKSNLSNDPDLKPYLDSFTCKTLTPVLSSLFHSVTSTNFNCKYISVNNSSKMINSDAPPSKKLKMTLDIDSLIDKSAKISVQIEDHITGNNSLTTEQRESLFHVISKYEMLKKKL